MKKEGWKITNITQIEPGWYLEFQKDDKWVYTRIPGLCLINHWINEETWETIQPITTDDVVLIDDNHIEDMIYLPDETATIIVTKRRFAKIDYRNE